MTTSQAQAQATPPRPLTPWGKVAASAAAAVLGYSYGSGLLLSLAVHTVGPVLSFFINHTSGSGIHLT